MTPEQQLAIQTLRDTGHCVVIWTPEELGNINTSALEDIVIERGNNFIEWAKAEED